MRDQFKMYLDEMYQYTQAFDRNNKILAENWQDKKSDHFADTCISVINGNCQQLMQTVEQVRTGLNSSLEQLKAMKEELEKDMRTPASSYGSK